MKKNIFLISASPLTYNIYVRSGAKKLSEYFNVYVLDCLELFYSQEISYIKYSPDFCKTIEITDVEQINHLVDELKPIFFYDLIGRSNKTIFIQKICRKHSIIYIHGSLTKQPSSSMLKNKFLKFMSSQNTHIVRVVGQIINMLKSYKTHISPDIVLMAGKTGTIWEMSAINRLHTGSHSYFEAISYSKNLDKYPRLISAPYILFIDDCFMDSFDYQLGHQRPVIESKDYFTMLNKYFSFVEEELKVDIVIAAHPNGLEYDDYSSLFNGRRVVFNETCRLSRDCYFAMTHLSLALHFPILFGKPIFLLGFDELDQQIKKIQKTYKKLLGCSRINLSKSKFERLEVPIVSQVKYSDFVDAYIMDRANYVSETYQPLIKHFQL